MKLTNSLSYALKIALMGVLALLLLIPLAMVQSQIRDRQNAADSSRDEVAASWGRAQTLTGPVLKFSYDYEVLDNDSIPGRWYMISTRRPRRCTAPSTTSWCMGPMSS